MPVKHSMGTVSGQPRICLLSSQGDSGKPKLLMIVSGTNYPTKPPSLCPLPPGPLLTRAGFIQRKPKPTPAATGAQLDVACSSHAAALAQLKTAQQLVPAPVLMLHKGAGNVNDCTGLTAGGCWCRRHQQKEIQFLLALEPRTGLARNEQSLYMFAI